MTATSGGPRYDLGWMRRRPRPGERAEQPQQAAEPAASLDLGRSAAATAIIGAPPPAPVVRRAEGGRTILSAAEPTATLDRRQSAIGSLEIRLAGSGWLGAAWELVDGTSGLVAAPTGVTTAPEFGRRAIVELREARLLVGLRHVHQLRRLLVMCGGAGSEPGPPRRLAFLLHGGESVECSVEAHPGGEVIAAVAGYQLSGELLLRREGFGFADPQTAALAYGFALSWLPPIR